MSDQTASGRWKVIVVALLVTGCSAAAYYYINSTAKKNDGSKKEVKRKRKSKRSVAPSSEAAAVNEIVSPVSDATVSDAPANVTGDESLAALKEQHSHLFPQNIDELTKDTRDKLANEAKIIGNRLYSLKSFASAVDFYSQAIALSSSAIYYSNRAACYSNLADYENVISDCSQALAMDPKYLKALGRRATAYEKLGRLTEALNDYTSVCVLEGFRNEATMASPDRVLKELAAAKAKQMFASRTAALPSDTFLTAYFDSFRAQPSHESLVVSSDNKHESVVLLRTAFDCVKLHSYKDALDAVNKAIEVADFANDSFAAFALNLRGTIYFLMGRVDDAISDIDNALQVIPQDVNSLIKRATLHMERNEIEKTIDIFSQIEKSSPAHVDMFYHRGQVRFLTGDFQGAVDDYSASIENEKENESSVYVHIQMAVAKYKLGDIASAEKKFKESRSLFPDSPDVYNYHGEVLMDRQSFSDALKCFDKAIEMCPTSPLPYVNKSILYVQWKQDINTAEQVCREALKVDPLCDLAYQHLGQLLCHLNRIDEAVDVYDKAAAVCRTENELMSIISCREAALAQLHVAKTFPGLMEALRQSALA